MTTSARAALALPLVLLAAGCGDGSGPDGRIVSPNQVVAQCTVATIEDGGTLETYEGSIGPSDCRIRGDEGKLEGYRVPQSAFGELTEIRFEVEAGFDAYLVVAGPDGMPIAYVDDDVGGDVGHEVLHLAFDLDAGEPEYFVAVYDAWDEGGDYTLRVGPLPPP